MHKIHKDNNLESILLGGRSRGGDAVAAGRISRQAVARGVLLFALLAALLPAAEGRAQDADGDQMPDAWEIKFGLSETNAADALIDSDADGLTNLWEYAAGSDPLNQDSDADGIFDGADQYPVSRFYIRWGDPDFTEGDSYACTAPSWGLGAYRLDGAWGTNPVSWYVPESESNAVGSLNVDLDRAQLTNNLVYAVHYLSTSNSSLYLALLDTNGASVVDDLYGNLMAGSNAPTIVLLGVPLAYFTNAAVLHLFRGAGAITVYEGLLYIDEDLDFLDAEAERQAGTSDYSWDTDGNGVSDYAQWMFSNGTNGLPFPDGGGGGGGSTNNTDGGTSAPTGLIFVDKAIGSPMLTGRAPEVRGSDGPKKTISEGLSAAEQDGAHTLIIKTGAYGEDLDLRGKHLRVVIEGNVRL
ncbi:MAG: hypothetical protein HYV35_12730 [Lentisphaerae bacterium]|nr:hypothetical protein [Lentisphaerota bacterium]